MNLEILKIKVKMGLGFIFNPITKFLFHPAQRRDTYYAWYYKHMQIQKRVILYEAFSGRGLLCGPYALFQELIRHPKYSSYRHIWVLDHMEDHRKLIQTYKRMHSNVSFVQFGSRKYLKYLASAKYLINNVTFYSYFVKKPGQIYINTWHGIPLKHIGYDVPDGVLTAFNMARNFLHADYLISSNAFLTDIYMHSYKQDGLSSVKIIEEGYPRFDLLVNTEKSVIYQKLHDAGVDVNPDKKIILYAPTWRGSSTAEPDCSMDDFVNLKKVLEEMIDTETYQILVKVHQAVYNKIKETLVSFAYVIPATIDANEVLSITDILISDYSSIYFDYLATGRPVLFYITDLNEYLQKRGMYFDIKELPGPCTDDLVTLGTWINKIDDIFAKNINRYDQVRNWCCNYEIGSISKKIVAAVFDGRTDGIHITECKGQKKKVLISRGPMLVNGISTALINLLNEFNYDEYDVSVLVNSPRDEVQKELILRLNSKARIIVRSGEMVKSVTEQIRNNFYMQTNPIKGFTKWIFPKQTYKREFRRLFGESEFDYIIDYEGFGSFFATVCLMQENAGSYIWLHSDMLSEYHARFHWLEKIFVLYPQFDYLVSSSRQIMEVNRNNFSKYVAEEKFRYAKNCVNFTSVHMGSASGKVIRKKDNYYYAVPDNGNSITNMMLIPLQPGRFDEIAERSVEICSSQKKIDNGVKRFVTVGRLSVEKNQAELIRAFARLAGEHKDVMLYIIGHGPERGNLENLIRELELKDRVILTGRLSNPFGLMNQCNCFILPSLYEGQPLVVFEARALHLPVILSDFASVEGSVIENGQYMVHMDVDSIYEGLQAFLLGKVPDDYLFQDEVYNREAYAEFEQAVFGD